MAEKGFLHAHASKHGLALVFPDTSPRGAQIAGEDDAWDFGSGAGFYVDATAAPWNANYNMYSYVSAELPAALWAAFPQLDAARVGITGHSMGGHGALTIALKNPGAYKSVSAFAPIANPSECAWGKKAFGGYFGPRDAAASEWAAHDATELVRRSSGFRALVDVGTGDGFYKDGQLLTENFEAAAKEAGAEVTVRYQKVSQSDQGSRGGADEYRTMTTATTSSRRLGRTILPITRSTSRHSWRGLISSLNPICPTQTSR